MTLGPRAKAAVLAATITTLTLRCDGSAPADMHVYACQQTAECAPGFDCRDGICQSVDGAGGGTAGGGTAGGGAAGGGTAGGGTAGGGAAGGGVAGGGTAGGGAAGGGAAGGGAAGGGTAGGGAALANGTACSASASCASGRCIDGVCCATNCTGACQRCTAPGGTCVSESTNFRDPLCGAYACGASGACRTSCTGNSECASNARCSAASGNVCVLPVSQLVDGFSAGLDTNVWSSYSQSAAITITPDAGSVFVGIPASVAMPYYAGIYTSQGWDLLNSSLTVNASFPNNPEVLTYAALTSNQRGVGIDTIGASVEAYYRFDDGGSTYVGFMTLGDVRRYRFISDGGEMYWQVADGGGAFVTVAKANIPASLSLLDLHPGFGSGRRSATTGSAFTSQVEGFNAP